MDRGSSVCLAHESIPSQVCVWGRLGDSKSENKKRRGHQIFSSGRRDVQGKDSGADQLNLTPQPLHLAAAHSNARSCCITTSPPPTNYSSNTTTDSSLVLRGTYMSPALGKLERGSRVTKCYFILHSSPVFVLNGTILFVFILIK